MIINFIDSVVDVPSFTYLH